MSPREQMEAQVYALSDQRRRLLEVAYELRKTQQLDDDPEASDEAAVYSAAAMLCDHSAKLTPEVFENTRDIRILWVVVSLQAFGIILSVGMSGGILGILLVIAQR